MPYRSILANMTVLRMDNVGIVVDDLAAAIAFFVELGLELQGQTSVEGDWVDGVLGLDDVRADIAILRTPGGHGRIELSRFKTPRPIDDQAKSAPPNTLGLCRIMFTVDDIDDAVARLRNHGGELLGKVIRYENAYRLCYLRGPAGFIVALAEPLRDGDSSSY